MAQSVGKRFEQNWKNSVPSYILYYRPPDSAQGFDVGSSGKLRFSQHSPCDCMMFDGETGKFYTLELKSVQSTSISFERTKEEKGVIHRYQLDSLKKFGEYNNVISGFLLDFRKSDNTYFVGIDDVLNMINNIDKKSFNENDLSTRCSPILIHKQKLRTNYRYDVKFFLKSTSI